MPLRHPALPRLWLLTDERQGDALWTALAWLPRGSGVVLRHRDSSARIERIARRGHLVLAHERVDSAGACVMLPRRGRHPPGRIARVHSSREALAARRSDAVAVFVSPVFATRSHPGVRPLGPLRAARIARAAGMPAFALGGMTRHRFARLRALGFAGWAAVDGLTPAQKRKAVPK